MVSRGVEYEVVWDGRGPLLPPREERHDTRFQGMPTFDIDDGEGEVVKPKRKYTRTGKHKGKFSRTNPAAMQYKPKDGGSGGK
jgi:hypothetical protein